MVYDWMAEGEISKVIANKLTVMPLEGEGGNETWMLPFWSKLLSQPKLSVVWSASFCVLAPATCPKDAPWAIH